MKVYCDRCSKYLGEIFKAKLRLEITYLCPACNTRSKLAESCMNNKKADMKKTDVPDCIKDLLGGFGV